MGHTEEVPRFERLRVFFTGGTQWPHSKASQFVSSGFCISCETYQWKKYQDLLNKIGFPSPDEVFDCDARQPTGRCSAASKSYARWNSRPCRKDIYLLLTTIAFPSLCDDMYFIWSIAKSGLASEWFHVVVRYISSILANIPVPSVYFSPTDTFSPNALRRFENSSAYSDVIAKLSFLQSRDMLPLSRCTCLSKHRW